MFNLEKLYITNNNLKNLNGLDNCQMLKTLCVYKNKISDFNSMLLILGDLRLLEELDIEENPVNQERSNPIQEI